MKNNKLIKKIVSLTLALLMLTSFFGVGQLNSKIYAGGDFKLKVKFVPVIDNDLKILMFQQGNRDGQIEQTINHVDGGNFLQKPYYPPLDRYDFKGWMVRYQGNTKGIVDLDRKIDINNDSWVIPLEGGSSFSIPIIHDTMNLNLYAKLVRKDNNVKLNISFDTQTSQDIPQQVIVNSGKINDNFVMQANGIKEFKGWTIEAAGWEHYTVDLSKTISNEIDDDDEIYWEIPMKDSNGNQKTYRTSSLLDKVRDLTLHAKWEGPNVVGILKHKVTFDADGGEPAPAEQEVISTKYAIKPEKDPVKKGFVFDGWFCEQSQSVIDFATYQITQDTTLKALYKEAYIIEFDVNGGTPAPEYQNVLPNTKLTKPADPSKEGYKFVGWYAPSMNRPFDFNNPIRDSFVLTAKYEKGVETPSTTSTKRDDITISAEDYDKAIIVYKEPFINGYPDSTFRPKNTITRAEMSTVFARILGIQNKPLDGTAKFSDIRGHWAEDNILRLAEYGLLNGYPDGTFKPEKTMSKSEITSIIAKYWKNKGFTPNATDAGIKDITNHWAKDYVTGLYNHGFVNIHNDRFSPDAPLKREEVAQILNRLTDRPLRNFAQQFTDVTSNSWAYQEINTAANKAD